MRIYIAYKFEEERKDALRKELEQIDDIIHGFGHKTFIFFRDIQKWGVAKKKDFKDILKTAFSELRKSDAILIEATQTGTGQGLETGYAKALGKKIIVICKKGIKLHLYKAIADVYIEYDTLECLKEELKKFLSNA